MINLNAPAHQTSSDRLRTQVQAVTAKPSCGNRAGRLAALAFAAMLLCLGVGASHAQAQQVIGHHPTHGPICDGPLGAGPCHAVSAWLSRNFPGAGSLPPDALIVGQIARSCGGEPICMASAWASVEVSRCRSGIGVPGGCFGPNGEIMRVINRMVPPHLQPNNVLRNIQNDVTRGPGDTNDITGRNGWLRQRLGF